MTKMITIDIEQAERMIDYEPELSDDVIPVDLVAAALCLLEYVTGGRFYDTWKGQQPRQSRLFEIALEGLTVLVRN